MKIIHLILNPSDKTLEADTNELNKYFNETGKRLTTTKLHSNDELKYLIRSFPGKNNGFQLQTAKLADGRMFMKKGKFVQNLFTILSVWARWLEKHNLLAIEKIC